MARYSSGMTTAGAGTSLRPVFALLSTATVTGLIRKAQIFNTTTTGCTFQLVHFTGGTAGATQVARKYRRNAPPALITPKGLWTVDATIVENIGGPIDLGAAVGSGVILTFGENGLETDLGATAGIGWVPVGTGQVVRAEFDWDC